MLTDEPTENLSIFKRIVDQVPALVAYWDAECRNVAANAAFGEWFGVDSSDIHGVHVSEVLGRDNYALNLPFIEAVLRGEPQLFDRTYVDVNGRTRHTQVSYTPDFVAGRVVGFFAMLAEITERVEAERATVRAFDQYRALIQSVPDAFVASFDTDLRIVVADGKGLQAFGLRPEEVEGRSLFDVVPERADNVAQHMRRALAGEESHWTRSINGRVYAFIATPVNNDGVPTGLGMVIGRDVTDQRRLEVTSVALHRLAMAAAQRASLDDIVDLVARSTLELFDADYAGVVRFDPDGMRILSLAPLSDRRGALLKDSDNTATALVAQLGTAQIVEHDTTVNSDGALADLMLTSSAAAPIKIGQRLWGVVGVGVLRHFTDRNATLEVLENFANLVSLAISNNDAWNELDQQAHRDPLTSLPNRRVFEDQLNSDLDRATTADVPIAVAIIDLDHFKVVNDTYGHQVGDEVLIEVASRLRTNCRSGELVSRLGGEEFAVVLSDCPPNQLWAACERFRRCISDAVFDHDITLTASVGAAVRMGNTDSSTLIRLADRALYRAKDEGRDQVVIHSPTPTLD